MRNFNARTIAIILPLIPPAFCTSFLNHSRLLGTTEDPGWYEDNVPFVELPDQKIQDVYYHRLQSYKEHLFYTSTENGYISTEFLLPVGYGGPYGGIVAAAGHHITEGRWLRDVTYGQDLVKYVSRKMLLLWVDERMTLVTNHDQWMAGPGISAKDATYDLNPDTTDWVHQYSFWAATSVWKQYLVTGDSDFAISQLDNLVQYYAGYDNHFNETLGLYWQAPVWDASEYTAASYETDPADPYHGGYGYRPTINSYQFGDAAAISALAALAGNANLAQKFQSKSKAIENATQALLWDSNDRFFKHRARDNNSDGSLLDTREIMGYLPWMFNMSLTPDYAEAFTQLMDASGFASTYGPTTTEKRSSWYMHDAAQGCCRWTGPAWPFATSQTLTAVENLLHDYPAQSYITSSDYFTLVSQYVAMHSKSGQPYVAEAHWPDQDAWIYDTEGHSEDYNHSTFIDNILTGLLGLRPQSGSSLAVNPLIPTSWSYFGLENVAYHGHNVTILWDRNGTHYGQGSGLQIWVDDVLTESRSDLGPLTVTLDSERPQVGRAEINIAVNSLRNNTGTRPTASFTSAFGGDDVWHAIDGTIFRVGIPENTRWTTYASPNKTDWYAITFASPQTLTKVDLYFYDDAGGVRLPASYDLQYLNGTSWLTVPSQTLHGELTANALARITFPSITSTALRVVAPNSKDGIGWGLSEFEVWINPP